MATAIKDIQEDPRERALQEKVATGYQLEDVEEMRAVQNVLVNTIHIVGRLGSRHVADLFARNQDVSNPGRQYYAAACKTNLAMPR